MTMVTTIVSIYYSVLMTYIIYFFFASMTDTLPWQHCENDWNTDLCLTTDQVANKTFLEEYLKGISSFKYIAVSMNSLIIFKYFFCHWFVSYNSYTSRKYGGV